MRNICEFPICVFFFSDVVRGQGPQYHAGSDGFLFIFIIEFPYVLSAFIVDVQCMRYAIGRT